MSFIINQGFSLKSPQFNFERDYFKDVASLKAASLNDFPDHFITNVAGVLYVLNKSNADDSATGKWRAFRTTTGNATVIDSAFSSTSTNPVQNKVVNAAINNRVDKYANNTTNINFSLTVPTINSNNKQEGTTIINKSGITSTDTSGTKKQVSISKGSISFETTDNTGTDAGNIVINNDGIQVDVDYGINKDGELKGSKLILEGITVMDVPSSSGTPEVETAIKVNNTLTANKIAIKNGTSSQVLLANGDVSNLNGANGIPKLDSNGKIPVSLLTNLADGAIDNATIDKLFA